ncbi:MAG: amino acid adenylation domain-containing protein [Blastocatellia bacterium]
MESELRRNERIKEAVVVAREDVPGEKRLVAYFVSKEQQAPSSGELRSFLKEKLPDYMIPTLFVSLDALPLTHSGKLDRRALPLPEMSGYKSEKSFVAPRTFIEKGVAGIWAEIMGLERVGLLDDFFDLGGHSLLATQVVARIRNSFNVELRLRDFFEARSVSGLAEVIRQQIGIRQDEQAPPIEPAFRDDHLPLSFAQERLWFLDQLESGSPFYNIPATVRLTGQLNIEALAQTFNVILSRHEALRTVFRPVEGHPVQVVTPARTLEMTLVDLSDITHESRHEAAMLLASKEARRPFDLTEDTLLRATLLRLADQEHIVLLTMHHIASDIWSRAVLIREVTALYRAFCDGTLAALPELPVQYADYAVWQRQWLQGSVLESQLSYWKQQLASAPPVLEIPADRPRPPIQTLEGAHQSNYLQDSLQAKLKALSNAEGSTMFMTLLCAFAALLNRYSNQDDILVGTPVLNRDRVETEGLIGFFTNTLVMRIDVSGNPTFRELLHRVRDAALAAYAHQDLPFEQLVEELQPVRDMSYPPVFQVMFVHQMLPSEELELSELALSPIIVDSGTAKFDLTLFMIEGRDSLAQMLEYSTDLFDAGTIKRLLSQLETLLETVVENADLKLSDLPLLTPDPLHQQLIEWNDTEIDFSGQLNIVERFETQVKLTPDRTALVFGGDHITYRELNQKANKLAHWFNHQGIGPDTLVAIALERSIDMMIGVLATFKAGGAFLPLDPTYPQDRLAAMLEDARPAILMTQTHLADKFPAGDAKLLLIDGAWERLKDEGDQNPSHVAELDNLAYLIYTSGSTGKPKGIAMTYRPLSNLLNWEMRDAIVHKEVRTLQYSSLSFDMAYLEMFATWFSGGAVILVAEEDRRDSQKLLRLLGDSCVERLFLPFVALQNLTEVAAGHGVVPTSLRELVTAGEQLLITGAVAGFFEKLGHCTLFNQYGPSECHVVTCLTLKDSPWEWPALPSVGRPVANTQIYLLDGNLHPVPVGVHGEVYIGGCSLGRGYLNRPDISADKFVPDHMGSNAGARLYKTGDKARYLSDGKIEFLGRTDHQVKVRGFRIELGEIETVLSQHPAVKEVVVAAHGKTATDKHLVAYIVADQEPRPAVSELRSFVKKNLPEYMVPSAFMLVDSLPLTPSGKVDRRALPDADSESLERESYVAPRSPIEEMVAGVIASVLGIERVGMQDNFFALGGHSLLATQIISRLREACPAELYLRWIFEEPTVAALAEKIEKAISEGQGQHIPQIEPVSRGEKIPASFIQERLWRLAGMEGRPSYYSLEINLAGSVNRQALEQSLNEVVRRHEVLRTSFVYEDGELSQVVDDKRFLSMPVVDLSGLPGEQQALESARLADELGQRRFDLESGMLMRVVLLRFKDEEYSLLFTIAHIACDHWSLRLITREVAAIYEAFCNANPSPLPELPFQYADFAAWERRWLQADALETELGFWRRQLDGCAPILRLPTDRPRPPVKTYRGSHRIFALDRELTGLIRELSRRENSTLFMTLLSAFKALLFSLTQQEDMIVGTAVAGRHQVNMEGLMGSFGTPLAMRTRFSGDSTFRHLLRQVRDVALAAYAHQYLSFDKLVEELKPEHDPSFSPLIQVGFVVHSAPHEAQELPSLSMRVKARDAGRSFFDLTLRFEDTGSGLNGSFEFNLDLFDESTIDRMISQLKDLLRSIVSDPDQSISALALLIELEQRQSLTA